MAGLSDILDLLRRWDAWKRMEEAPTRIDALEARIAELEKRLQRAPGEACPSCGELEFRVAKSVSNPFFGRTGAIDRDMQCKSCGFREVRLVKP